MTHRRKRFINGIIVILALAANAFPAMPFDVGAPILPLSEIRPGMKGIGKTVFIGHNIEDFGVEVIDKIENFYPQLDVILVRMTGEQAERAGIVSGMSGSPVYINDKLVGALAMRFGDFMKEPIGGIMPIEYMIQAAERENVRHLEVQQAFSSLLPKYIESAMCQVEDHFWSDLVTTSMHQPFKSTVAYLETIASPLVFSGFRANLIAQYQHIFTSFGFVPVTGGGTLGTADSHERLLPGSAVAQVFIAGDLGIEATGTVTAVAGDKVLAFGHHIFNLGPIDLPLAGAKILTTLPSLMGSTKMAASTQVIGSFRQDRLSGVVGDLSIPPKMTPVRVTIASPADGAREFNFQVALNKPINNLIPFYLRIALIQALTSARLTGGMNSMNLNGTIELGNGKLVEFKDFFSSQQQLGFLATGSDAVAASDLVTGYMGALLINDFESPDIRRIDLNTTVQPGEKTAKIKTVSQDRFIAEPGEMITLNAILEDRNGKNQTITTNFRIPKLLDANQLTIFISSAGALTRYEMQANVQKFIPTNFEHLLEILKNRRQNNKLYFQVRVQDQGMLLSGQELQNLPPSVFKVMDSRLQSGATLRVAERILFEKAVATEYVITGAKRLTVRIDKPPKAATLPNTEQDENKPKPTFWW